MAKRHATPFINQNLFICVVVLLLLPMADEGAKVYDNARSLTGEEKRLTREYHLRQGAIRGLIVKPGRQYDLQHVEMFLGIPYAAPPIGRLRFMPPVSAPPWPGVKMATRFAPVCPQALPQIKKENPPSPGRQEYLKRLRPFLAHESEDCLYLNIYVPYREQKSKKFPVLVFIHGDSFEWSSGNPYDGRILASYGNVMVITLNFRLGILGFMKPSHTEHNYGNNGLLDQMAALQWIKDNIQDLNGDPNSITLMGHGTGAACVSYLMMSHICDAKELFHRAILMSGSALSDWAITKDPTPYTMQVAQSLGCNPTAKNMMECMQRKPLSEIKKVQILAREFETPLGPAVLGAIISEPEKTLESYPYLLSKYQLLSGVTEMESYHDFYNIELTSGMLEKQRDEFISKYAKIVFDVITGAEHEALKEILKQYSPSKQDPQQWTVETNRDVVLNLFSDARTLAPMISFANYQCKANRQSYFYVFGHNSVSTEYAHLNKSIHGEEMPYVLGIPLGGANSHFHSEYTQNEKLLSEFIMRLWTNFVKNGSPNTQSVNEYQTFDKRQWSLYNVEWPEYNVEHQPYLRIDMPPYISSLYRSNYTKFWIDTLPKKMSRYMVDPLFQFTPAAPTTQRPKPAHAPIQHRTAEPVRKMWAPSVAGPTHYSSVPYGVLRPYSPPEQHSGTNDIYRQIQSIKTPSRYVPPNLMEKGEAAIQTTPKPAINLPVKTSSATITLIISLAVLFLAVNIAICAILYFKKRRLRQERTSQAPQLRAEIGEVDVIGQKSSKDDKSALQSLKNGYSVIRSMSIKKMRSNSKKAKKEVCKTPKSDDSGGFRERFQLRRHLSTSTLDAHTKVRDWIANEVMHRCSPGILRKSNSDLNEKALSVAKPFTRSEELLSDSKRSKNKPSNIDNALSPNLHTHKKTNLSKNKTSEKTTSTSALGSHSSIGSNKQSFISKNTEKSNDSLRSKESESSKSKKVSVAIDATPAARTNSILNQEPIEISKSFDLNERQHSGVDNKLQRSKTESDSSKDIIEIRPTKNEEQKIFTNVVTLSLERDRPLKISHKHSVSDPVSDVNYDLLMKQMQKDAEIANILPPITFRNDVNMTSRDDKISLQPLSAEESLLTIKKRNFPKVLPDLPKAQKRLSLQPTSLQSFRGYIGNVESQFDRPKVPPQPPPRTTTLERRLAYKNSKPLSSFDASNMNKIPESKNYENIDSLSPYSEIHKSSNRSFETPSSSSDKSRTGAVTQDREYPKVIIASSDMASTPEPKILITLSPSQVDIPTNVPRVRLPDDFHSHTTGSITSFSSLCSDEELDDEIDEEQLDDIAEDKLINELVGGVESPTERYVLDSKGPATIFEKQLEIVPVKLNTVRVQPRSMEDYVCVSDLRLPDVSDLEKTAQIKPNFGLNKLSHRSESIHRPPEKAIKIKQKRTLKPTLLNRGSKSSRSGSGKSSDFSSLEHSNSGSSNDTETSTGTVKKVDFK